MEIIATIGRSIRKHRVFRSNHLYTESEFAKSSNTKKVENTFFNAGSQSREVVVYHPMGELIKIG